MPAAGTRPPAVGGRPSAAARPPAISRASFWVQIPVPPQRCLVSGGPKIAATWRPPFWSRKNGLKTGISAESEQIFLGLRLAWVLDWLAPNSHVSGAVRVLPVPRASDEAQNAKGMSIAHCQTAPKLEVSRLSYERQTGCHMPPA